MLLTHKTMAIIAHKLSKCYGPSNNYTITWKLTWLSQSVNWLPKILTTGIRFTAAAAIFLCHYVCRTSETHPASDHVYHGILPQG
jgi:hypothetical protein